MERTLRRMFTEDTTKKAMLVKEQALKEGRMDVAQKMLQEGLEEKLVAKITEFSLGEIQKLKVDLNISKGKN